LLHPYSLTLFRKILMQVETMRAAFNAMPIRSPAVIIAREELRSAIETSPLMFDHLDQMLRQVEEETLRMLQNNPLLHKACDDSLLNLAPSTMLSSLLDAQTNLITRHPALKSNIQRTQLLVPLDNFLDLPLVVKRLATGGGEKDVLSKVGLKDHAPQMRMCARCESKSELRWIDARTKVPHTNPSGGARWAAFEGQWEGNCVCGGGWMMVAESK